jgi:hypothetical protein
MSDEPSGYSERRLYRWHPDQGHYSLVREDDDDGEEYDDNLYEYDTERRFFKRYQPPLKPLPPTKPRQSTTAASTVLCPAPRRPHSREGVSSTRTAGAQADREGLCGSPQGAIPIR